MNAGFLPILDWSGLDEASRAAALERPAAGDESRVREIAERVIARVRRGGDDALRELTRELDGVPAGAIAVEPRALADAAAALPEDLRKALRSAGERIEAFHRRGMMDEFEIETAPGVRCGRLVRPIGRVGLYVPSGTAPLPSTVLMLAIPARLAGCPEVVLCSPPSGEGGVNPVVLAAARLCGISRVFAVGGAQAVAAMAYGTATVPRCDKIFGPGNAYVDAAKQAVARDPAGAAIDLPAGPSELLVIADGGADPAYVAADLLSQAEHGSDSQTLLISDSAEILSEVRRELAVQLAELPRAEIATRAMERSRLILVPRLLEAFSISNRYAPEHLIVAVREPRAWLRAIERAGSVFLGDHTPEVLGDYNSGTNHVLPTGGAARAFSGVSVASFQTTISVQEATPAGLEAIGPGAALLAEAEGLNAHQRAVTRRLAGAGV